MTDWLPPDQVATRKWPVVGERAPPSDAPDTERWRLTLDGAVDRALDLSWPEVLALPQEDLVCDVHCVTRWSHRAMRFRGTRLVHLLDRAGVDPAAVSVHFTAWSARGHDSSLPLEVAREDSWLVHTADAAPLPRAHGGPLRVVTTGRYFYKSLKWVRAVEVATTHRLGYWERTDGYHDDADPWPGDQRYVAGSLAPKMLAALTGATSFARWHERTVYSADLRRWRPATRAIGAIRLKNCDLRGADMRGADLRGANFTLSDLRGADLRDTVLVGADLEGALLAGADLRCADMSGALLTGASFFDANARARVAQLRWTGAEGLLEAQIRYLEENA